MSLGKGLESLIPPAPRGGSSESAPAEHARGHEADSSPRTTEHIFYIETDRISPNPHQPRREFNEEELASLASSIRRYGVLQPLVVTKKETDVPYGRTVSYELMAGERRLRAARLAGFSQVPVVIKEADEQDKLELALIENIQREDLNPIEEAGAYQKLVSDFSLTQEQIASRVGKARETVANTLRLLTLPKDVQQYIADGLLSEGHGKVLLSAESPERVRLLAREAIKRGWSVRALEDQTAKSERPREAAPAPDPRMEHYKKIVEEQLGTTVSISGRPEKGRLAISFHSPEDLERLVARLTGDLSPRPPDSAPEDTSGNTSDTTSDSAPDSFTV